MARRILFGLVLVILLSCTDDKGNDGSIKQQDGVVWLSGSLVICAEQIHLDNGDTLIVKFEDIIAFRAGDRVNVKY